MKFYFPTSTLNFDAIYSSMSLMPPRYHCDEAIWFPRYFKTDVDLSDEVFVLYSSPICWEISDYDSDNYPMLIEVDSSIVGRILPDHAHTFQKSLTNGISCIIRNFPIVFNANDILSGCVKVLFRKPEEKRTLITRARIGVSESKLPAALKSLNIDIACETFPNDVVNFDSIKTEVLSVINSSGLIFGQKDFEEFERQDRMAGAIAGFHAGKWLRSMREGYCLDCFRNGLDYFAWKKSIPTEFAAIIDMLCGMIGFRWNVNRDAIVDFCTKCWQTCFETSGDREAPCYKQWHEILNAIAKSHKDATFSYPVAAIQDCYMQAIACFIKTGKRYKQLAESIRDDNIAVPELALALHGALVGYSVFSRVLFEKRSYDRASEASNLRPLKPSAPQPSVNVQLPQDKPVNSLLPQWACHILEIFRNQICTARPKYYTERAELADSLEELIRKCASRRELLHELPSVRGWGKGSYAYKDLTKALSNDGQCELGIEGKSVDPAMPSSQVNEMCVSVGGFQLISDITFSTVVADFFRKNLSWTRAQQMAMKRNAEWFQKEYSSGGRYNQNPKDNISTVRHFVNLVNRKHPLSEFERETFEMFLKSRYK